MVPAVRNLAGMGKNDGGYLAGTGAHSAQRGLMNQYERISHDKSSPNGAGRRRKEGRISGEGEVRYSGKALIIHRGGERVMAACSTEPTHKTQELH